MTKGKTTLIPKDPRKRINSRNWRLIAFLPMMRKILAAQLWDEIYSSLVRCKLFPEEEIGYPKETRTGDILYIDQLILKESKTRRKNVALIKNKKAFYLVSQSWIIDSLRMYKIFDKVIKFTTKARKKCNGELTAGSILVVAARMTMDELLYIVWLNGSVNVAS